MRHKVRVWDKQGNKWFEPELSRGYYGLDALKHTLVVETMKINSELSLTYVPVFLGDFEVYQCTFLLASKFRPPFGMSLNPDELIWEGDLLLSGSGVVCEVHYSSDHGSFGLFDGSGFFTFDQLIKDDSSIIYVGHKRDHPELDPPAPVSQISTNIFE